MIEIAGRLPFLTIETSNSKSQNDGEILNCRIIMTNHTSQNPRFTAFQVGCIQTHKWTTHTHTQKHAHHVMVFNYT